MKPIAVLTAALTAAAVLLATAAPADARQVHDPKASPHLETVQELVLNDGSRFYGVVESESDAEVVFRTTAGAVVRAPAAEVESVRPVTGRILEGRFRREDPNGTRLLFGPTGRSLRKGESYLGIYEFVMPFVQVGITDRISVGGGTPLFFGPGEFDRPYWITPKVGLYSRGGTHVAVGLFHGFGPGGEGAGITYGVLTRELAEGSFTVGAGMGYTTDGERGAVFMAGADRPLRRNLKLITENYVWASTGVLSGGVRFFGDNLSADLAMAVFFPNGQVIAAPVVNFAYRF
jgi:hypothetical protein